MWACSSTTRLAKLTLSSFTRRHPLAGVCEPFYRFGNCVSCGCGVSGHHGPEGEEPGAGEVAASPSPVLSGENRLIQLFWLVWPY